MKRIILILCLAFLGSTPALAMDLHEAKAAGLIGERNDGYLGFVVTPPGEDVKTLVKDVNNKRKAKFSSTAEKNKVQTEQVANRFYQRAVKETGSGDYYQNATGSWVKK
jgi:uncharacterized protein YdbL (DUF1318 family)